MTVAVKVCGLGDPACVDTAVAHGARMIGLVSFAASPRHVDAERAAALAARIPERLDRVGVMVDPDDDALAAFIAAAGLTMVQLHGAETPARVEAIRRRHGVAAIKAIPVGEPADLARARDYEEAADLLMFDARPPRDASRPGGNAVAFDWRLLSGRRWRRPWMLSGGLDTGNVARAVAVSGAPMVDVSSGVESRPGVKSPALIRAFLEAAGSLR